MKHKKWAIATGIALVITAVIIICTEAYLDIGRNALAMGGLFILCTLLIWVVLAAVSAVRAAAPHAKRQLAEMENITPPPEKWRKHKKNRGNARKRQLYC